MHGEDLLCSWKKHVPPASGRTIDTIRVLSGPTHNLAHGCQSKEGSWFVTATFDRDGDGKPRSPSAPVVCWNAIFEGRYGNLYT